MRKRRQERRAENEITGTAETKRGSSRARGEKLDGGARDHKGGCGRVKKIVARNPKGLLKLEQRSSARDYSSWENPLRAVHGKRRPGLLSALLQLKPEDTPFKRRRFASRSPGIAGKEKQSSVERPREDYLEGRRRKAMQVSSKGLHNKRQLKWRSPISDKRAYHLHEK